MKAPVIPCDWEDLPEPPGYPPQTLQDYKNILFIKISESNNFGYELGEQAVRKIDTIFLQVFGGKN